MSVIRTLKVKNSDGAFGDAVPLGSKTKYILKDDGTPLEKNGSLNIAPAEIGAYTKDEVDQAINKIIPNDIGAYTKEEVNQAIASITAENLDAYTKEEVETRLTDAMARTYLLEVPASNWVATTPEYVDNDDEIVITTLAALETWLESGTERIAMLNQHITLEENYTLREGYTLKVSSKKSLQLDDNVVFTLSDGSELIVDNGSSIIFNNLSGLRGTGTFTNNGTLENDNEDDSVWSIISLEEPEKDWYKNNVNVSGMTRDTILTNIQLAPQYANSEDAQSAMKQWVDLVTSKDAVVFYAKKEITADFAVIATEFKNTITTLGASYNTVIV